MSLRSTPSVIQLPPVQLFIKSLIQQDRADVQSELALAETVHMVGTHFKQQTTDPTLWALTIPANGHNWCLLAHWDAQQAGTNVVCTHVFQKGSGPIPRSELDKALRLYALSKSMGGV